MHLDQATLLRLREEAKKSLFFLARAIVGFSDLDPLIHKPVCDTIQDYEHNPRVTVELPRTWFKSSICSIAYPIWRAINNPNVRILIAQNIYTNATKKMQAIKGVFDKNALFRTLFFDVLPTKDCRWSTECLEVKRSMPHPEGTFEAVGVGTTATSRHYDVIIEDDTIAPKKDDLTGIVQQPTQMDIERAIGWHNLCHPMLLHPTKSQIIVVGTRWAERDLLGFIYSKFAEYVRIKKAACEKDGEAATLEEGGKPTWPDRFGADVLDAIARQEGPYMFACTPGFAEILMSDFSSKPIAYVHVGDEIVGVDFGKKGERAKTVPAKVIAKGCKKDRIVKLTMLSGRNVYCTVDHQWLIDPRHRNSRPHLMYRSVAKYNTKGEPELITQRADGKAKIPGLWFVCEPNVERIDDEHKKDWARWLAGIYDGEGSCNIDQRHIVLSQSQTHNPHVCFVIRYVLDMLGFPYNEHYKKDSIDFRSGRLQSGGVMWTLAGGFETRRRFLHQIAPVRNEPIIASLFQSAFLQYEDKVVHVENAGEADVYWLETTTGNYVSQGYVSKNSLYLGKPTAAINQVFKREWIEYFDRHPKRCFACTSVDLAAADKEESSDPDYNVILTTAVEPSSGRVFVLEYTRGRMSPGEVIEAIFGHYARHNPIKVRIEAIGYQRVVAGFLRQRQRKANVLFAVEEITGYRGSKEERIRGLQPYFANRLVAIRPGMVELEQELLAFPKGAHDDIVDAMSMQKDFWTEMTEMKEAMKEDEPKDPFMGEVIIKELLERRDALNHYPYDGGNMDLRWLNEEVYSAAMRREMIERAEERRRLSVLV